MTLPMSPLRALLLSAVAPAVVALAAKPKPPAQSPETPAVASTETADHILGINEAVSIPKAWIQHHLIHPAAEPTALALDAEYTRALGARWVRGNSPVYPYWSYLDMRRAGFDWTRADNWVKALGDRDLDAVVVLGPWPGTQTARYTRRYIPGDLDAYAAYVRRVVERYDGDGKDDMPGLRRPIKVWEVDNEPDLHNSLPARGAPRNAVDPATFETPEQYAEVLRVTAQAIKTADPGATVLSGGIYRPHAPAGQSYMQQLFSIDGVLDAIDGVSLHCYFETDDLEPVDRTLQAAKDLAPGKPVWITETSVPSQRPKPWVNEEWQGRMVAAIIGAFIAGGAQEVFWHTLADPPSSIRVRNPFSSHSLLRSLSSNAPLDAGMPRDLKPAGQVYRRLAQVLSTADRHEVAEVPNKGGRLLKVGRSWIAFSGRPRVPAGARTSTDLLTGATSPVGSRVTAPAWLRP